MKQCTKCQEYKVYSNRYEINGYLLCIECVGN
jgi:formylmethanofuran dehydrogenase subunit E